MQIPSYQIQNVLKVYSKQLTQGKLLAKSKAAGRGTPPSADSVTISAKGKRQAIIDKVADNIVNRITTEGPNEHLEAQIAQQIEKEVGKKINFPRNNENQFTYTHVDENNEKVTKTLSVEDSEFIMKRMTELAKKLADENMES